MLGLDTDTDRFTPRYKLNTKTTSQLWGRSELRIVGPAVESLYELSYPS